MAGIAVNTLIQFERGTRVPKESTVQALRRALMKQEA